MMVLQNRDNGGLCPFTWQQFRVFLRVDVAEICHSRVFCAKVLHRIDMIYQDCPGLFRHLCELVGESIDHEFQTIRHAEFGID
jgi:hypothetical protein